MSATDFLKKLYATLAAAAFLMLAVAFRVSAAGQIPVLESKVIGDSLYLYVRGEQTVTAPEARIGNSRSTDVRIRSSKKDLPVRTYLLVDNSISISKENRNAIRDLLTNIVAGKLPNESFTLCMFSDHLSVVTEDSSDYAALKGQIDGIQYNDQETYLTDVVNEVLNREAGKEGDAFVRMLVCSDGVDNNPGGITRAELETKLASRNIPIYTVGCPRKGNEKNLKEMYALSRATGARNWTFGQTGALDIVSAMAGEEAPSSIEVVLPEEVKDGAQKGVRVTLGEGTETETVQVVMPFGKIKETTAAETTTAAPRETEKETEPEDVPPPEDPTFFEKYRTLLIVGGILLLLAVVGGIVFAVLKNKKNKESIVPLPPGPGPMPQPPQGHNGGSQSGTDTDILFGNNKVLMLRLQDLKNPVKQFEYPLHGHVKLGKKPEICQVVIDYDKSVSKLHCEIYAQGNKFFIRDLNSTNGTYVDNKRIADVHELYSGSTIRLGRVEMKVWIR